MYFIPDIEKPVDRCTCVESTEKFMLFNCIILPLAQVDTGVCPANWKIQSLFAVVVIPIRFLNSHVHAVMLGALVCILLGGAFLVSCRTQ